jgi:RNA polymerase sigma-70 factor (ECF subfamily)
MKARSRREEYVGPWLPEPILDQQQVALESQAERAQDLGLALLLPLQILTPLERAAYLLHDILDVSYEEVAETIGREVGAIRKLAERSRIRISLEGRRFAPPPEEVERVFLAFRTAVMTGNFEQVEERKDAQVKGASSVKVAEVWASP